MFCLTHIGHGKTSNPNVNLSNRHRIPAVHILQSSDFDREVFEELAINISAHHARLPKFSARKGNQHKESDFRVVHKFVQSDKEQFSSDPSQRCVFYYNGDPESMNAIGIQLMSQKYFLDKFGTHLLGVDLIRNVCRHNVDIITLWTRCPNGRGMFSCPVCESWLTVSLIMPGR